jgi:hypothetical protein
MGTNNFDWQSFLRQWSGDVLASSLAGGMPESVRQSGWLGLPPASEEQIADAERRLRIPLPLSYKSFLRVTDGWRRPTRSIDLIRRVDQIDWFRKAHKDWIKAYSIPATIDPGGVPDAEYFAYGEHASDFKSSHLKEMLQISEVGDAAVYLLNPQVISKGGEWEAWFLANWLPGVRRYRSFREMMQSDVSPVRRYGVESPGWYGRGAARRIPRLAGLTETSREEKTQASGAEDSESCLEQVDRG